MGKAQAQLLSDEGLLQPWPKKVRSYLESSKASFEVFTHQPTPSMAEAIGLSNLDLSDLIRAVMLGDEQGMVMAIMPAERMLDFSALCQWLGRELEPVSDFNQKDIFVDCIEGAIPPLAGVYSVDAVIDQSVFEQEQVVFEPGNHQVLVQMDAHEFKRMHTTTPVGDFTAKVESLTQAKVDDLHSIVNKFTPRRMHDRVEEIFELPALPKIADELLVLRADPDATSIKLANIIGKDPSLSAQLICWARSSFYGYPGKIESVEDAIIKVLGYDLVMSLSLGIVVGRALNVPNDGPLGLNAHWRHSLYCAVYVQELAKRVDPTLPKGMAYLAGLLHNIGHLILGDVFPPQFFLLNRYATVNPNVSICAIEQHVLGVRHEQIGGWLMQAWQMPKEIIAAVKWHHQGEFVDEHGIYPNLVLIANRMLHDLNIGDEVSTQVPKAVMENIGLSFDTLQEVHQAILDQQEALDDVCKQFVS